jgi:hypothetical protein
VRFPENGLDVNVGRRALQQPPNGVILKFDVPKTGAVAGERLASGWCSAPTVT